MVNDWYGHVPSQPIHHYHQRILSSQQNHAWLSLSLKVLIWSDEKSQKKKKDCFNRRRGCVLARAYKCVCAWRSYFQKVTSLCLAQAWISGQNSSAAITCIYGFLFTTVSFQQATVILYNYLYNLIIYVCAYLYAKPHTCWYLFNAPIFCIC